MIRTEAVAEIHLRFYLFCLFRHAPTDADTSLGATACCVLDLTPAAAGRYQFDAKEAQQYTVQSSGFTVMQVVDTDETTTLAENDKGHAISWVCPANGEYFLVISSRGTKFGKYVVSIK
jgi:hypothetical protein|eukprot:COSAG01_NODE_23772_length_802_cov_1.266003_1_plen_119_part_00